jgi:4-hydroxy-tetrahydrodipicolinate synthase
LLTTPIYTKPGPFGQTEHFSQLMAASDHACMLYNVPSRTGVPLHQQAVGELAARDQDGKFAAIKVSKSEKKSRS